MKHKGAESIAKKISGLSPADELDSWKLRNGEKRGSHYVLIKGKK